MLKFRWFVYVDEKCLYYLILLFGIWSSRLEFIFNHENCWFFSVLVFGSRNKIPFLIYHFRKFKTITPTIPAISIYSCLSLSFDSSSLCWFFVISMWHIKIVALVQHVIHQTVNACHITDRDSRHKGTCLNHLNF